MCQKLQEKDRELMSFCYQACRPSSEASDPFNFNLPWLIEQLNKRQILYNERPLEGSTFVWQDGSPNYFLFTGI